MWWKTGRLLALVTGVIFFPQSAPEGETRGQTVTHSERVFHLPIAIAQLIKF